MKKHDYKKAALELLQKYKLLKQTLLKYKDEITRISVLALVLVVSCYISYTAGRGAKQKPAAILDMTDQSGEQDTSVQDSLKEPPHFEFPPYASYSDATPANAEIMEMDVLNLAYIYEDGSDFTEPSFSYAGRLYSRLSGMDAKWSSGIYDLYHYTPERLAAQLGLPIQTVTTKAGVIPEFKNVNIRFLDGSGNASGGLSNARCIVSMANTLYYYGILENMDQLEAYVSQLWTSSHHYSVRMGDIYYCDGSCSADAASAVSFDAADATPSEAEMNTPAGAFIAESEEAAKTAASAGTQESPGVSSESNAGQSAAADTEGPGVETVPAETSVTGSAETSGKSSDETSEAAPVKASETASAEVNETAPAEADETVPVESTGADQPACPGHVDLSITITVKGITEPDSLFAADKQGANAVGQSGWQGWTKTAMAAVETISGQDWYETYGINTTDLSVRNPLTSAEIDIYMTMVPEDTSRMKKDFIRYALSSVGKIPYYWGGKPTAPGYTDNNFGAIVAPDEDGRFLKGLDCSGWINWVYWSITGRGLGAESTGTLLSSGRAVSREQLVPGDICIRTAPTAHVVIFLGWAADGQMLCIQETSGNINNVEVGIATSEWQSYRRIIE